MLSLAKFNKAPVKTVVLGTGWSAFSLVRSLKSPITVVSPRNHFVFTPLLCSTTVGTLEFRAITEPIRRLRNVEYFEGGCTEISMDEKKVLYNDLHGKSHQIQYDRLILAYGNVSNTFNIPGAKENALFLREIHHARKIRKKIIECLEDASHPEVSEQERKRLLHFCIVGAGATGVEFGGELYDFLKSDVLKSYPQLVPYMHISIFDVGNRVLNTFDKSLSNYAESKFKRDGINLRMSTRIIKVHPTAIELLTGEMVPYGLLVWSTGLTEHPLTSKLQVDKNKGRIVVDAFCRVLRDGRPFGNVYAIGDCAIGSSQSNQLPQTAQVAAQEGLYLAKEFNSEKEVQPFKYRHFMSMAYIGSWKSVIDKPGVGYLHGTLAWLLWRSAYFTQTVSLRNKILIPVYWFTSWLFGRDISRIKE
eukprot:NODE_142_length_15935_cov_1.439126.p6 type:complete len:418 gc:universal NODE_142_length_15935_cov_1.439126:6338-7591(+)